MKNIIIALLVAEFIQDFNLCKLDKCAVTTGTQSAAKSQKIEYLSRLFLYRTETQYSCYTPHKVSWNVLCDISMATEWAPGSIQSGKSEFPSFKKCYLLLLFIQWVWANMDITKHKHKKVR